MFITIISGVIVFVISQFIMETAIKPRNQFNEIKGKILCYLTMYANLICNPCEIKKDNDPKNEDNYRLASKDIRMVASEFAGILEAHPIICNKKKYREVVNNLIGISNGFFQIDSKHDMIKDNREFVNFIYKKFKINKKI